MIHGHVFVMYCLGYPLEDFPRSSVVRITDSLDTNIPVFCGHEVLTQKELFIRILGAACSKI